MSRHVNILDKDKSALVIIDVQVKFAPVIKDIQTITMQMEKLIQGCHLHDIPMWMTEQYPKGLGKTVPELLKYVSKNDLFEKMTFSAAEHLIPALKDHMIKQVILAGIETHVCVLQTALDLQHSGYQVYVVEDAVSSRNSKHRDIALARMAQHGITITCTESVLFELTEIAGTDMFKSISKLVK
ncbi:isochorismatase family protein [candidate division KSB1 bacterium]|jgi:nicotinamidase-related amidase|nr:isochorismatase family protein [candidate division KSB1 bacterium]